MVSIVVKKQKCGKSNCHCSSGELHGPYFWKVEYIKKKRGQSGPTKYSWKYIGRSVEQVLSFIDTNFPDLASHYDRDSLSSQITNLHLRTDRQSVSQKIFDSNQ